MEDRGYETSSYARVASRTDGEIGTSMLLPSAASRRAVLHGMALLAASQVPSQRAVAFDNRLPPDELELKYKTPRTPGPKPQDLGTRRP